MTISPFNGTKPAFPKQVVLDGRFGLLATIQLSFLDFSYPSRPKMISEIAGGILRLAYRTPPCPRAGLSPSTNTVPNIFRQSSLSPPRGHRAVIQRRSSCPPHVPRLYLRAAFRSNPISNSLRNKRKSCLSDSAPAS